MNPLEVVCAVIVNHDGELLCCQRNSASSLAGKWEFPGGKIELNESAEEALKREIIEELEVRISILKPLEIVKHHYKNLDFEIALSPYLCEIESSATPKAIEHAQLRWVHPANADELDWADADMKILHQYKNSLFPS